MINHLVKSWYILVILTLLSGCSPEPELELELEPESPPIPVPLDSPDTVETHVQISGAPELEKLRDTTLYGIYPHPITLTDGHWEGEPYAAGGASRPTVGLLTNYYLKGDLDGDGSEEAIVMLWQSSGGSGVYSYLAIFSWRNGEVVNTGLAPIGDRVQIRSARIDNKQIILNVIQQGPDDAACCPSQKATRYWSLKKDYLQEQPTEIEGLLNITDIADREWQLIRLGRNQPLPESAKVTLKIEGNRLSGQGPCDRYFAEIEAGDGAGEIKISQPGATMMACPDPLMSLEQRYFKLLSGVTRYSFIMGHLALSWHSENEHSTMIFK